MRRIKWDLRAILDRVSVAKNGCWIWRRAFYRDGYGRVKFRGRDTVAHIASYEVLVGPVPAGLELDHTCRVRACVNPAHLEPVTTRENQRRIPGSFTALKLAQTHCIRGHALSGKNLFIRSNGSRRCQACERERQKLTRATPQYRAAHAAYERTRRQRRKEQAA